MRTAHRRLLQAAATVMVVMALGTLPLSNSLWLVAAQSTDVASAAQQTGIPAALHDGSCPDTGAVVAPLTNAVLPSGSPVGNIDALPAANSFTTVPLSLATILASDHAIVIADPIDNAPIACGEIGGSLAEEESLAVGLAGQQSSGVHGIAFLSPGSDGGSTGVSLFVTVPGDLTQAPVPSQPTPVPAAEQTTADIAPIESGGLGLPIEEFYARYGEAAPDPVMDGEVIRTANGRIRVRAAGNDKVNAVTRYFDEGVTFDEARATGLGFAPADSVLLQTYTTSVGSTVDLYYSPSLEAQFSETHDVDGMEFPTWVNGEPGQFIIGYGGYNPANEVNEVTRIVMALGNNP